LESTISKVRKSLLLFLEGFHLLPCSAKEEKRENLQISKICLTILITKYPKSYPEWNDSHLTLSIKTKPDISINSANAFGSIPSWKKKWEEWEKYFVIWDTDDFEESNLLVRVSQIVVPNLATSQLSLQRTCLLPSWT